MKLRSNGLPAKREVRDSRANPSVARPSPAAVAVAICVALSTGACAQGEAPPRAASSASSVSYARQYPKDVERVSERFEQDTRAAAESVDELAQFPDALDDPDWALVQRIYEKADEEGRGRAYAERREEEDTVLAFYGDERKKLVGRVAGANQHAAKEKGYEVQLYGTTDWALERGINERLEERRRGATDAHALVDANAKKLGPKNTKALTEQVDDILLASYVAHVGAAKQEYELRELVGQASEARSALERRRDELKEQEEPPAEEVKQVDEGLAELEPAVERAEALLKDAEQKRIDFETKYDDAMSKLRGTVSDRMREKEDASADEASAGE